MAAPILQNLAGILGPVILVGAMALVASGLALIASSNRIRDEMLARRVGMVQPGAALVADGSEENAGPSEEHLFRLPVRGMSEPSQREVVRRFSKLKVSAGHAHSYFVATRLIVAASLGALTFFWASNIAAIAAFPLIPVAIMVMAAILGWFVPMMVIAHSVKQRSKVVRSGLPDALELLVVCVEAGLSLEDGLDRVVNELRRSQPALADELALTLADLKILPSRDQALANLAERVDVPSVRSVVTTLAQTLRYGTPLAQSLRVVAAELRNDYLVELEERANRLPAYLTLPVIVFLMPTIFLIVGGPAALRLLDAFQR
jgi:tight adherence protein C